MRLSLFSSKKLFAVLIKGDNNLYTIESKLLPKKRPHFVSPFTQDLNFNESTRGKGEVAPGWRQLDLRMCVIKESTRDKKKFKIVI